MSDQEQKPKPRCSEISHPNLMPGWGCCNCRIFNGNQRSECKNCGHKRCDKNPANQVS